MRPAAFALLAAAPFLAAQAPDRVQRFTLPNGLPVLLLEDHERPLVRIRLRIALDPAEVPPAHPGLPGFLLRLMDRSEAGDLRPEELDRALDGSGIDWRQGVGPRGFTWDLVARSRDQDRALGLLAQRLLRTVLDPGELETQRLAAWQEAEGTGRTPPARLGALLEPDPALRPPTLDGLSTLDPEELQVFQARVLRPDRAVLVLHGDLGLEQAKRLALLSLGTWTASSLSAGPAPAKAAPPPPASGPVLLPVPGAPLQLQAVATAPADLPPEARALLERLLGSLVTAPIRISLTDDRLAISLDEGARAWSDLLGPLENLRRTGFAEADLGRARAAWIAGLAVNGLHPEARMEQAIRAFRNQVPDRAKVETLGLDALNAALRQWLDPANLRVGAAGDSAVLEGLARP